MRKLNSSDIKDLNLLKHYRLIRKWACRNNNLNDADLGLLIYFDCMDLFTKQDFKIGTYAYSWDNRRWNKMIKNNWIVVWRNRNRTTQKYNIYKVSFKCRQLIAKMYRIMLGEDGMIMDDGIVCKINNNHVIATTTSLINLVSRSHS